MSPLNLQVAATREVDGLLNLYVLVCASEGSLVTDLTGEAFECVASAASGQPLLLQKDFVQAHAGCYRLALHHEPQVRTELLALSVRRRVRTNPIGLTPVHATVAEGHVLVWLKRDFGI